MSADILPWWRHLCGVRWSQGPISLHIFPDYRLLHLKNFKNARINLHVNVDIIVNLSSLCSNSLSKDMFVTFVSVSQWLWRCFSLLAFLSSPRRSPAPPVASIPTQRVRPLALLDSWRKGRAAAKGPKAPQRFRQQYRAYAEDRALSIPAALSRRPLQGLREKPLDGE